MDKLGLGTVQWGTDYGVTNHSGMTSAEDVTAILGLAMEAGVRTLDTAAAYGLAEDVLGVQAAAKAGFEIVTKTLPLRGLSLDAATSLKMVGDRFHISLEKLRAPSVYGLLVHHADDLLGPNGALLWRGLEKLKADGYVKKIGCSLYGPQQFFALLQRYPLDLIQVPYNVYDQRYVVDGIADVAKTNGIEVHTRSAYLQGILLCPPASLPIRSPDLQLRHEALWRQYGVLGVSPLEAALGFCLACDHIDRVLVGCADVTQVRQAVAVARNLPSSSKLRELVPFALADESIINPSRWSL